MALQKFRSSGTQTFWARAHILSLGFGEIARVAAERTVDEKNPMPETARPANLPAAGPWR
jgi:hypothetical protein